MNSEKSEYSSRLNVDDICIELDDIRQQSNSQKAALLILKQQQRRAAGGRGGQPLDQSLEQINEEQSASQTSKDSRH